MTKSEASQEPFDSPEIIDPFFKEIEPEYPQDISGPRVFDLPLAPEPSLEGFPRTFEISSSNPKNDPYLVTLISPEAGVCTCQGFSYRRRCRHINEAKKMLAVEG